MGSSHSTLAGHMAIPKCHTGCHMAIPKRHTGCQIVSPTCQDWMQAGQGAAEGGHQTGRGQRHIGGRRSRRSIEEAPSPLPREPHAAGGPRHLLQGYPVPQVPRAGWQSRCRRRMPPSPPPSCLRAHSSSPRPCSLWSSNICGQIQAALSVRTSVPCQG